MESRIRRFENLKLFTNGNMPIKISFSDVNGDINRVGILSNLP